MDDTGDPVSAHRKLYLATLGDRALFTFIEMFTSEACNPKRMAARRISDGTYSSIDDTVVDPAVADTKFLLSTLNDRLLFKITEDINSEAWSPKRIAARQKIDRINGPFVQYTGPDGPEHPLVNVDIIARHIFGYLNLKDIKNCRQVCTKWANGSMSLLKQRSQIVFKSGSSGSEGNNRSIEDFYETFPDLLSPFTAFEFSDSNFYTSDINKFIEKQKLTIKQLSLINVVMQSSVTNDKFVTANLGRLLNTAITKLIVVTDDIENQVDTVFYVDIDDLANITDLTLFNCRINICKGVRLAPKYLHLSGVSFFEEHSLVPSYRLNDSFNFMSTEVITLCLNELLPSFVLDVGEGFPWRNLSLENVACNSTAANSPVVDSLSVYSMPLQELPAMKIREMKLEACELTITSFPEAMERLAIKSHCIFLDPLLFDVSLMLMHLTYLSVTVPENDPSIISYFKSCPYLVELKISVKKGSSLCSDNNADFTLDLNDIPPSVKKMKIRGTPLVVHQGRLSFLDYLVLENCSLNNARHIITHLIPQNLVAVLNDVDTQYDNESVINFLPLVGSMNMIFYVGDFNWGDIDAVWGYTHYSQGRLASFVNKASRCYVFEKGVGQAITENDFKEIAKFKSLRPKHVPSSTL